MIFVDVSVPSFDKVYDFNLDENVRIDVIIKEIVEMICQKEQCRLIGNINELVLGSFDGENILQNQKTLKQCGVRTGSRLILI